MSPLPVRSPVRYPVRALLGAAVLVVLPVVGTSPPASAAAVPPTSDAAPATGTAASRADLRDPGLRDPGLREPGLRDLRLPQFWRWPLLPAPRVVGAFDPPAKPWLAGHRGVDLAAFPGQPVLSAATGVVVFAGPLAGRGVVSVEYGGIRSSYEPVVPLVRPGDRVVVGQPVALVAPLPRHCGVRTCLHWGAFVSLSAPRRYIDPRVLVGAGPVRLLPPGGRATAPSARRLPVTSGGPIPSSPVLPAPSSSVTSSVAPSVAPSVAVSPTGVAPVVQRPSGSTATARPDHDASASRAVSPAEAGAVGLATLGGGLAVGVTARGRRLRARRS